MEHKDPHIQIHGKAYKQWLEQRKKREQTREKICRQGQAPEEMKKIQSEILK